MDHEGLYDSKVVVLSEEEILRDYWPYWSEKMKSKGFTDLTKEDCLDDWIVVNWAWESKD